MLATIRWPRPTTMSAGHKASATGCVRAERGGALGRLHSRLGGTGGVVRDRLDDVRPDGARQVVAHALDHAQAGAGNRLGGGASTGGANERVTGAVDHGGRYAQAAQRPGAVAGGGDRVQLAEDPGVAVA